MTNLRNKLIRALCLLFTGILLVCVSDEAPRWITIFIGILLSLSGLVSLFSLLRKDVGRRELYLYPVLGVVTLALGLFMVLRPTLFNTLLLFLLAGLLVLVGLVQAYSRVRMQRMGIPISWATYLVPLLTIAAGIYVFLYPAEASSVPFIILGAAYVMHAAMEIWSTLDLHRWQKEHKEEIEANKRPEASKNSENSTDSEHSEDSENAKDSENTVESISVDVESED